MHGTVSRVTLTPDRRLLLWPVVLALILLAQACSAPPDPQDAISAPLTVPPISSPPISSTVTPVDVETQSIASTPTPGVDYLTAAVPVSSDTAISLPDEQTIVSAILTQGNSEHWVAHVRSGSFTGARLDEQLALVGNIGENDDVRWVVIGRAGEDSWQLLGASEWLGSGFDTPPSFYLSPELVDFDNDGQQELLSHYARTQWGSTTATDALYRWDGYTMARIWRAETISDNRMAESQDVPHPYRENRQGEWRWVDIDGDGLNEIVLQEQTTFHPLEPSSAADDPGSLGEISGERAFRWDGTAFRPYALDGSFGIFAYTVLGDLWLWRDYGAHPTGAKHVRDIRWSMDSTMLAWWAKPSLEEECQENNLGIYDSAMETLRAFSLAPDSDLAGLGWTPDNRLVYASQGQSPVLLDPQTGQTEPFPDVSTGTWSPSGDRVAYEKDGNLLIYDFAERQEHPLVFPPEGAEAPAVLPDPEWSPRGDWIAYLVANKTAVWIGLVAPSLAEPVSGFGILETFDGLESPRVQFAWSPHGSHLAVLTGDQRSGQGPVALYVGELPAGGNRGVGLIDWRPILQFEGMDLDSIKLTWGPSGDWLLLAAGNEIIQVDISEGEDIEERTSIRWQFALPELEWTVLEWAPDGSGFLVGVGWAYDEYLYWFPAEGGEPVLLLAGSLGNIRWSPRATSGPAGPAMVLVEFTDSIPLLHFVGPDGSDVVVPAKGAERDTQFHVGNNRVYYNKAYADRTGTASLFVSDDLAGCHPPLLSPDGGRLVWLCDDGTPQWSDIISGTAEVQFRVMLTDDQGRSAREVWRYTEAGPDYRDIRLLGWRADGGAVYLSRPKYGTAWAYFDYNPGILILDIGTGEMTQVGDLGTVHDGMVSPDGTWLVQSEIQESPNEGVFLRLSSLVDGTERIIDSAEGSTVAGDFSFSPGGAWIAWREWATQPGGSIFLIRVLSLPDGEPLTVYGDAETTAPKLGGWTGRDQLVLVHPPQEGGTGSYSTVVELPAVGVGEPLAPFTFSGRLDASP
jgi:hypothetical protein